MELFKVDFWYLCKGDFFVTLGPRDYKDNCFPVFFFFTFLEENGRFLQLVVTKNGIKSLRKIGTPIPHKVRIYTNPNTLPTTCRAWFLSFVSFECIKKPTKCHLAKKIENRQK